VAKRGSFRRTNNLVNVAEYGTGYGMPDRRLMLVTVNFVDDSVEVECHSFTLLEGRLILRDEGGQTLYVANVDRWISFEVSDDTE